ncbi:glycosyltransferase family 4 protein [Xanthomonas medicagonis]|uniref:glycosyltransferase family 4 protein n=1 Tax=Xanthomonas medicagonis TaxID=3160841 RepID=UPI0035112D11
MHVAQINFVRTPPGLAPAQVFAHWPSLGDISEAVASAGTRVSVIQAAHGTEQLLRNGVEYHFADAGDDEDRRVGNVAGMVRALGADVVHVHGLEFAREACAMARRLPRLPILLQDHANRPPRWWRRGQWRQWYAAAAGIAFTSLELARGFVQAGLFAPSTRLFAIPESSCRFMPGDQAQARRDSGLHGAPCVLWVGHLSAGKDPLTVLDGVARAAARLPGLQLFCAFGSAPMRETVEDRIQRDPRLRGRVHLLGKVAHAQIQTLMRAADLFVSGSLSESCGYAALEALACGTPPVLTDIPAFRALTDCGRIGELWPCGDAGLLAEALVHAASELPAPARVRAHFDAQLSFAAVGRRWARAYAQLLEQPARSGA